MRLYILCHISYFWPIFCSPTPQEQKSSQRDTAFAFFYIFMLIFSYLIQPEIFKLQSFVRLPKDFKLASVI